MKQNVSTGRVDLGKVKDLLSNCSKVLIVCGNTYLNSELRKNIESSGINQVIFSGITPNPTYEQVLKGVDVFKHENCDAVLAIGGGSIIDVGKCIKLFGKRNYIHTDNLKGPYEENDVLLVAMPTTAGSGSEATHFAVIYVNGSKASIAHKSLLPKYVFLDASFLYTLPQYQRISVMLDALCHAIESLWSINVCEESFSYALKAMEFFWEGKESYLNNERNGNEKMLMAAHYAGKAINITKTTVCHALSYGMVTHFGIAHGHAVALSLSEVYAILTEKMAFLPDHKKKQLIKYFRVLFQAIGVEDFTSILEYVDMLLISLKEYVSFKPDIELIDNLTDTINVDRLNNFVIDISRSEIWEIYAKILGEI